MWAAAQALYRLALNSSPDTFAITVTMTEKDQPKSTTGTGNFSASFTLNLKGSGASVACDYAVLDHVELWSGNTQENSNYSIGTYTVNGSSASKGTHVSNNATVKFTYPASSNLYGKTIKVFYKGYSSLANDSLQFLAPDNSNYQRLFITTAENKVAASDDDPATWRQADQGNVVINKKDATTGAALSGAIFTLQIWNGSSYVTSTEYEIKEDGNTGVYRTYQKGTSTQAYIQVNSTNQGKIRVIESGAPSGHSNIDPATGNPYQWDRVIGEDQGVQTITINADNYADVGFQIVKTDANTAAALSGGVFTLYSDANCTTSVADANGNRTFTTNGNGQANVKFHLGAEQTYYMKETTAPTGYTVSGSKWKIVVAAAATGTITITEQKSGSSSWDPVTTITAANAKQLTAGKLPVGETGEPVGFRAVKRDGTDTSKTLSGAKFELFSNEACTSAYSVTDANGNHAFTTTANGQVDMKFILESGSQTYYFKETQPPTNYIGDDSVWRITVAAAATGTIKIEKKAAGASSYSPVTEISAANAKQLTAGIVYVDNQPATGTLKIKKNLSEASQRDVTFWFHVTNASGFSDWKSVTVTAGQTTATVTAWTNLTQGTYTVKEVKESGSDEAPTTSATFPWSPEPAGTINVSPNAEVTFEADNTVVKNGKLQIKKEVDKAAKEDKTFWFKVTGPTDNADYPNKSEFWVPVTVKKGEKSGVSTVQTGLYLGTYTIKEVKADQSDDAPTSTVDFPYNSADANGTIAVTVSSNTTPVEFKASNTMDVGDLTIRKHVDKELKDDYTFWFKIDGPDASMPIWRKITVKKGELAGSVSITGLQIGSYTVTEVTGDGLSTVPTASDTFPFDVEGGGSVNVTKGSPAGSDVYNTVEVGSLQIVKSLAGGAEKGGTFWFKIDGPDASCPRWEKITIAAGQTTGSVTLSNLVIGSYTVTEVTGDQSSTEPSASVTFPYDVSSSDKSVKVTKGGTVKSTWTNTLQKGSLTITKSIEGTTTEVGTFWFKVTGPTNNAAVNSKTQWVSIDVLAGTNKNNQYTFSNLDIGSYTITEVTGNNSNTEPTSSLMFPFVVSKDTSSVSVTKGNTVKSNWTNTLQTGELVIKKELSRASTIDRTFWFKVSGPSDNAMVASKDQWVKITVPSGSLTEQAVLSDLPIGTYTVKEVDGENSSAAPASSDDFPYTVKYIQDGKVTVLADTSVDTTVTNQLQVGKLQIYKTMNRISEIDREFWFYITGPEEYENWVSVKVTHGMYGSTTAEIEELQRGVYHILEVDKDGSTDPVVPSEEFPYEATGDDEVHVDPDVKTVANETNTQLPGSLQIKKETTNKSEVDRIFWFKVEGPDVSCPFWLKVNVKKGDTEALSDRRYHLEAGEYTITEVKEEYSHDQVESTDVFPYDVPDDVIAVVKAGGSDTETMINVLQVGSLQIEKNVSRAPFTEDRTFWFYLSGPNNPDGADKVEFWVPVTVKKGETTGKSEVVENLQRGAYTLKEVTGENSKVEVSPSDAFPYIATGDNGVTVTPKELAVGKRTNTLQVGKLQLTKKLSRACLEDQTFWFFIEGPDGYEGWTSITVKAGMSEAKSEILTDLQRGKYTVKEVVENGSRDEVEPSVAFPYKVAYKDASITVAPDELAETTITNTVVEGSLKITKNISKAPLEDLTVWFMLEGPADSAWKTQTWASVTVKAGETVGETVVTGLVIGDYTVKEVVADGDDEEVSVTEEFPYLASGDGEVVITDGEVSDATWTNEYRKGALKVIKIDDQGTKLEGIEYTVYDDAQQKIVLEVIVTDKDGVAVSGEFVIPEEGRRVYVKETKTDDEHVLGTPALIPVDLVPDEVVFAGGEEQINTKIFGKIAVLKTGEGFDSVKEQTTEFGTLKVPVFKQATLAGVTFLVFKASDVKVDEEVKTVEYDADKAVCKLVSEDAEVLTPLLPLGTYVVVEHEVPDGFVKVEYVGTVTIKKQNEIQSVVVEHLTHENRQAETEVSVYKEAEVMVTTKTGDRVATTVQIQPGEGFIFGVFAAEDFESASGDIIKTGDLVGLGATNIDGRIEFTTKLPLGKYTIKELETKDGYIIDENEYPVDLVAKDGEVIIKVSPTEDNESIINRLKKTPVTVTKKDLAGETPLPGTQIQVFDEEGHLIFDQVTDENGEIPVFYALCGRSYTFKETYAPSGFAILSAVLSFSVNEDGTIEGTTEVRDDITRIKLLKVDEGGQPLAGVEFTLFDSEELPIQVLVTGEDGIVEFTNVAYGDYVIVETKPAEGMALADFKKEIHVDGLWENDEEPITVVNHPEDKTGEPMTMFFFYLALFMLGGGSISLVLAHLYNKYWSKEVCMSE